MTIQKDIIGDTITYYVIQEEWLLEKKYAVLYRLSTGRYQHILIRVTDRKKSEFCYATDISASGCLTRWVDHVPTSGTIVKKSGVTYPTGISGIPTGWTVIEV